jgi:N-acetylglucosamine malate deacetylase 1
MKNILVIAAHPDDEILGCGGTIALHVKNGEQCHILFIADGESSRGTKDSVTITERKAKSAEAQKVIGANHPLFLDFEDNQMDKIPILEIVKKIEAIINRIQPSVIYTHHSGDLNVDHMIVNKAVLTACRPQPNFCVREIYSFEILSSTGWSSPYAHNNFVPNKYVDVSSTFDKKITALMCYEKEMREFPHARSVESVKALSAFRGTTVGFFKAEAFMVERHLS